MYFATSNLKISTTQSVNVGELALIAPLLSQLNIAQIIDRVIPTEAEYSHGVVLAALLAARLQSPTALVNVATWAEDHGAEFLLNIPPDKLNDDRLGRALDAFYLHRFTLLGDVTAEVLRQTKISLDSLHFDTTHIVVHGAYDTSVPRPLSTLEKYLELRRRQEFISDLTTSPAHITHGYLTKYRMVQLGATSIVDEFGALPVASHVVDGNRNGHVAIHQQYEIMRHHLNLPAGFLLTSDRGTCSADHFAALHDHGHHGLCAGPWNDYRNHFDRHFDQLQWNDATYMSLEQKRRRETASSMPLESHRLAVVDHSILHPRTKELIPARLIFVYSTANAKEAKQRREQNLAKIRAGMAKLAEKLVRAHPGTTAKTVEKAIGKLLGGKDAARYVDWKIEALTEAEQAALPAAARGYCKQKHRLVYTIDEAAAQADDRYDGIHVLVTTAPQTWSADALFTEYKRQTYVERGHRELKTPLAVAPVFLKTPERVEALISLMFMALQIYKTLERKYRQAVDREGEEARVTAQQLLREFAGCGLVLELHNYGTLVKEGGLTPRQRQILNRLSLERPAKIVARNLPPPPV